MLNYTINITQHTATGQNQDGKTKVYALRMENSDNICFSANPSEDFAGLVNAYEIVATATIIHPDVMAGSWDEAISMFCNRLYDELDKDGHIERDELDNEFWKP